MLPGKGDKMAGFMQSVMNSGALPQKPEVGGWRYGVQQAMNGRAAADIWKNEKLNNYYAKISNHLITELMDGRPQNRPISQAEWVGLLKHTDPRLLGDHKLVTAMQTITDMWNKNARAVMQANQSWGDNVKWSSKGGLAMDPATAKRAQSLGIYSRQPGQRMAITFPLMQTVMQQQQEGKTLPGMGGQQSLGAMGAPPPRTLAAPQQSMAPQGSQAKPMKNAKFSGYTYLPSDAQLGAEKVFYETPGKVRQAGLMAGSQQRAQTQGHIDRAKYDQANPPGSYATRIDPQTGMETKVWTGANQQTNLGRAPLSVNDQMAQMLTRFRQGGRAALNQYEKEYFDAKLRNFDQEMLMAIFAGKGMKPAQAAPQAQGQTGQASPSPEPAAPEKVQPQRRLIPPPPASPGQKIPTQVIQIYIDQITGGNRQPTRTELNQALQNAAQAGWDIN